MYKAIKEIGGYKPGEIVPDEKAEVWLQMYSMPHVEKVKTASESKEIVTGSSEDVMVDDYLARNAGVVRKNIKVDKLSLNTLKKLLSLEKKGKKRSNVIRAIEKAIEVAK